MTGKIVLSWLALTHAGIAPVLVAQGTNDRTQLQIMAITYLRPERMARTAKMVFDDHGQNRRGSPEENDAIRARFGFLPTATGDTAQCGAGALACASYPDSTVVVDVSEPAVKGDTATVIARSLSSKRTSNGGPWWGDESVTVKFVKEKTGWRMVSAKHVVG